MGSQERGIDSSGGRAGDDRDAEIGELPGEIA